MTNFRPVESAPALASMGGRKNRSDNSTHTTGPKLIDAASAAVLLGIGERSLWTFTKIRAIPSKRIGRSVRYAVAELDAWIGLGCPTEPDAADAVLAEVRRIGGGR